MPMNRMPVHAITNEISPLTILDSANRIIAIINIASKNNNDSEYHDLPLHNFHTGNRMIANAIMDTKDKIRPSNGPIGSKTKICVTVQ